MSKPDLTLHRIPPVDPDKIDLIITCWHCKEPLWRMKILARTGATVLSTEYKPIGDVRPYDDRNPVCPHCNRKFYQETNHGPKFRMYDEKHSVVRMMGGEG